MKMIFLIVAGDYQGWGIVGGEFAHARSTHWAWIAYGAAACLPAANAREFWGGHIRDLKVIKNLKGIWYYDESSSWDSSEFERDSYSLYVNGKPLCLSQPV